MDKIIIILLSLCAVSISFAGETFISCPKAQNITFTKEASLSSQGYLAEGYAKVYGSEEGAFLMLDITDANEAIQFRWAHLHHGDYPGINDFICYYLAKNPQGKEVEIALAEKEWTPYLANCHFMGKDKETCEGPLSSCELKCER